MKHLMKATAVAVALLAVGARANAQTPSGAEIVARSLKVSGMDTALKKHTSMKATGTFSLPAMGVEAPILQVKSATNEFRITVEVDGFGTVEQGYADGTAYSVNPQTGAMILDGAAALNAKRQAMWMDTPDMYASMTNVGQEKFEGKDVYKVNLVTKDSSKLTRYYDVQTGLPAGTQSESVTPDGAMQVTAIMMDYKDFGGVMLPAKQVQRSGDNEQVISITKVEWDVATKADWALPAAIVAMKKPK
jgi:hypothetical protein